MGLCNKILINILKNIKEMLFKYYIYVILKCEMKCEIIPFLRRIADYR